MKKEIKILLEKFNNNKNIYEKIELALQICLYYRYTTKEEKEWEYVNFALEESKKIDYQQGIAKANREIAIIHYTHLALDKALDFSFKALSIFKSLEDSKEISGTLCNIGVYYTALGLSEKGLDYFLQSIKYFPENILTLNNLGEHYAKQKDIDKAIKYFQKTIQLAEKLDKQADVAYALKNLGEVYIDLAECDQAIQYFEQSLQILKDIKDPNAEAFTLIGLSNSYMLLDDPEKALTYSLQAQKIANDINNAEVTWFCCKNLSQVYEALKDYENETKYLKSSLKLHEQMYSGKITNRIAELEAAYEIEKKELETRQMMEKSARLASIGVMAAGITHEINQPLNVITINSDGLLYKDDREKVLPQDYRESIQKIFKAASRIDEIVKHMRSFWITPEYEDLQTIELNQTIDHALSLVKQQIVSHGIRFNTELNAKPAFISGNKVHIEQIIINLTINALNSLDEVKSHDKEISIFTRFEDKNVILSIIDNGIGFPNGINDQLYDPFFSTRKAGEGMGLGLAIVKQYIEEMKGTINHRNRENGGAQFDIIIPLSGGKNENPDN